MKVKLLLFFIFIPIWIFSSTGASIKGIVADAITGVPISFAEIRSKNPNFIALSNHEGYFEITTDSFPLRIDISRIAYEDQIVHINSATDTIYIKLKLCEVYINRKYKDKFQAASLLEVASKRITQMANASGQECSKELVYYKQEISANNDVIDWTESFSEMNCSPSQMNYYRSGIMRHAKENIRKTATFPRFSSVNFLDFIKLPNVDVIDYCKNSAYYFYNNQKITMVTYKKYPYTMVFHINQRDSNILHITSLYNGKNKNKLENKQWIDSDSRYMEFGFEQSKNSKSYVLKYANFRSSFRSGARKEPTTTYTQNTTFYKVPDKVPVGKIISKYQLSESHIKTGIELADSVKLNLKDELDAFNNEIFMLHYKPYDSLFWSNYPLLKPTREENDRLQFFEENNLFVSNKIKNTNNAFTKNVKDLVTKLNQSPLYIEKVFLHTDRPDYLTGDTIWFKAYVLNGLGIDSTVLSKILYVDLINPDNLVNKTIKLKLNNGNAKGDFTLGNDLKQGKYRIRAYTNWMRNFPSEHFFEQTINVFKSNVKNLITINPIIKHSATGDSVNMFVKALLPPIFNDLRKSLQIQINVNDLFSIRNSIDFKDNLNTNFEFFIPSSSSNSSTDMVLTIVDTAFICEQRFSLNVKSQIDLQFFPESGKLVEGIESVVAYKAINEKGEAIAFEANIMDKNNNMVKHIISSKKGIGTFNLRPQIGKSYKALVNIDSVTHIFDLPSIEPTGYVLSYNLEETKFLIARRVNSKYAKHYITASVRGNIYSSIEINLSDGNTEFKLPFTEYPKGIVQVTLYDSLFRPLAERLVFNNRFDQKMKINVETDKKVYDKKEKISIIITTTNAKGEPIESVLSMSVVDNGKIDTTIQTPNIESYLFLSSELKGSIDYSSINLNDSSQLASQNIDVLLLTQGWRNYLWNSIKYSNEIGISYPVEQFLYLKGSIYNLPEGQKPTDYYLHIASEKIDGRGLGQPALIELDESGKFISRFVNFINSYKLTLYSHKKVKNVERRIKEDKPTDIRFKLDTLVIPPITYYENNLDFTHIKENYYQAIKEKIISKEDTIQFLNTIELNEVLIVAKKTWKPWLSKSDTVFHFETIDPTGKKYGNLFHFLREEVGVKAFTLKGNGAIYHMPIIVINGNPMMPFYAPYCKLDKDFPYDEGYEWASSVPVNEILDLKFYEAGSDYSNYLSPPPPRPSWEALKEGAPKLFWPVVSFNTSKKGYRGDAIGTKSLIYTGFYKEREFYAPKYESPNTNVIDTRTTIYWNPEIKTDKSGKATVSFYTSDLEGKALINVQGISYKINDASWVISEYFAK